MAAELEADTGPLKAHFDHGKGEFVLKPFDWVDPKQGQRDDQARDLRAADHRAKKKRLEILASRR